MAPEPPSPPRDPPQPPHIEPPQEVQGPSPASPHVSHDNPAPRDEQTPSTTPFPKLETLEHPAPSSGDSKLIPDAAKSSKTLPVPVPHDNPSQTSFVLPETGGGAEAVSAEPGVLPPEIARADVSIAADGSFVQTTSALAARELKKSYDQILRQRAEGEAVRSPYAITAVQDAFGQRVFRIGKRDPHESGGIEASSPQVPPPYAPGHAVGPRRKARLSVHDFLPSSMSMFKPSASASTPPRNTSSVALHSGSTPPMNGSSSSSTPHGPRKLRKSRSNSDLHLRGTSSPPIAGSSAGGDNSGHLSPPPRMESFALEIRDEVTAGADAFSQVLGWSSELTTDSAASSRKSVKSSVPPTPDGLTDPQDGLTPVPTADAVLSRRPSVSTSAALSSSNGDTASAPFGESIRYTAPMRRSAIYLASQPPQLREMQSFESGLTARIGDDQDAMPGTPKSKSKAAGKEKEAFLAAKSQARFSTTVFEVLQTYRGLPLPSTLSENSTEATIKLSTTDSANPKDDPRFVIWGEIQPEGSFLDDASLSQSSHTDLSASGASGVSGPGTRKRSNARPPHSSTDPPQLIVKSDGTPQTVMIAATVERWIAQLTSELNYDELLNFLLTYRTYISPVDLCHLLICRFHWALETPDSRQDDMVRRIVRVRTFIAIRYWVLTFFREDFLPNAELCQLFATWLNALFRDPALKKHADALGVVRRLKKIVRECKAAHSRHGRSGLGRPSMDSRSAPYTSLNGVLGDLAEGSSFSAPGKKIGGEKATEDHDDSDVDLDFSPEANAHYAEYSSGDGTLSSIHQLMINSGSGPSHTQPTVPRPPIQGRSPATPSANSILLSQPLSTTILGHVKQTTPGTDTPLAQISTSLPVQHSAISRAFVNTIGRLGRWKRVLNSRSSVPSPHCGDISAFDLELNATGDLLAVRGGVEEYLKMLNLSPPALPVPSPREGGVELGSEDIHPALPPGLVTSAEERLALDREKSTSSRPSSLHLDALKEEGEDAEIEDSFHDQPSVTRSRPLSGSEATDNSGRFSSEIPASAGWTPEIVSLDDYDLSDSDSSSHSPARVRRLPRRLPLRRDFQFVRRSIDSSVSSMDIRSHSSVASSVKSSDSVRSSRRSSASGGQPFVPGIQPWQIELIDTDDEAEAGDAEAALRRLEGQIDVDRQREKDMKVGRWLRTAHQRPDRDGASSIQSGSQSSDHEEDEDANISPVDPEDVTVSVSSVRSSTVATTSVAHEMSVGKPAPGTAASESTFKAAGGTASASDPASARSITERDRSGSIGSAQASNTSRPTSRPSSSAGIARRPSLLGRASRGPAPSKFGSPNVPPAHRSFILMHRSETLAQQFAIIEAQLFAKVTFEELISHQWGQSLEDVNVRDWAQFAKERAKLKSSGKSLEPAASAKLSAILVLRARFDILVNFTSSEVLLTHSSERVMVVEKFIRIAWKAYRHNNFSTLVALISGLQTRWVNQAMGRYWHKVGMWEQRVFDDLKQFTSRSGEFKYLRNATAALLDARPLRPGGQDGMNTPGLAGGTSTSTGKSRASESRDAPSACVPFLGMYLSQLYEHERLPDFVDPTAPAEPVLIDSETGNLSPPSHPEVFLNLQSLPRDLTLEPLINVHKQRLIAGVIKSFVAGQHLATNVRFEVDQKSYQKCYRLRSLEPDALHSIVKSFSDS